MTFLERKFLDSQSGLIEELSKRISLVELIYFAHLQKRTIKKLKGNQLPKEEEFRVR